MGSGKITVVSKPLRQCPECTYPLKTYPDLDRQYMITKCTNVRCDYTRTRKVKQVLNYEDK